MKARTMHRTSTLSPTLLRKFVQHVMERCRAYQKPVRTYGKSALADSRPEVVFGC